MSLGKARTIARVDKPGADPERRPDPEREKGCDGSGSDAHHEQALPALALPGSGTSCDRSSEKSSPDREGGGGNVADEERDAGGSAARAEEQERQEAAGLG
jgi:hypothetical protein